jgi:hypothetical protein
MNTISELSQTHKNFLTTIFGSSHSNIRLDIDGRRADARGSDDAIELLEACADHDGVAPRLYPVSADGCLDFLWREQDDAPANWFETLEPPPTAGASIGNCKTAYWALYDRPSADRAAPVIAKLGCADPATPAPIPNSAEALEVCEYDRCYSLDGLAEHLRVEFIPRPIAPSHFIATRDILEDLHASCDPAVLTVNGERVVAPDVCAILQILESADGDVFLHPVSEAGDVTMLHSFVPEDADVERDRGRPVFKVEPTLVLPTNDGVSAVWALFRPLSRTLVQPLAEAMGCDIERPVPICAKAYWLRRYKAVGDDPLGIVSKLEEAFGVKLAWPKPDTTKAPTKPVSDRQAALDLVLGFIAKMEPTDVAAQGKAEEGIALLKHEGDRTVTMTALKKKTGRSIADIRTAVNGKRPSDASGAGGGVVTLKDGHRVLQHRGVPDQVEHRQFGVNSVALQNRDETVFASQLGQMTRKTIDHAGRTTYEELTWSKFHAYLADLCSTSEVNSEGHIKSRQLLDKELTRIIYELLPENLPTQPEIMRVPVFRPDGELLAESGQFGDFYIDLGDLEIGLIPDVVEYADVEEQVKLLRGDLLPDFDFYDEIEGLGYREASEANALAAIMTPFAAPFFKGQIPVFGVNKPAEGAGGSLFGKISSLIYEGEEAETMPYTDDEAEMQKAILSAVRAGRKYLNFDNVRKFKSQTILRLSTSAHIGGRILGLTEWMSRPNNVIFNFSGIRPSTSPEMNRRTVWINLDSNTPNNKDRTYKHDLINWVPNNRGRLVTAVLTIIKYWVQQGKRPFSGKERLPSFDGWVSTMGGILECIGMRGFLQNPKPVSMDRETLELQAFGEAWVRENRSDPMNGSALFAWAYKAAPGIIHSLPTEGEGPFRDWLDGLIGRTWEVDGQRWKLMQSPDGSWWMNQRTHRAFAEAMVAHGGVVRGDELFAWAREAVPEVIDRLRRPTEAQAKAEGFVSIEFAQAAFRDWLSPLVGQSWEIGGQQWHLKRAPEGWWMARLRADA